jgi:putative ABC transport system substrate-binding protein
LLRSARDCLNSGDGEGEACFFGKPRVAGALLAGLCRSGDIMRGVDESNMGECLGEVADQVALRPDVILATNSAVAFPLQKETRVIPVVFLSVSDPVGFGFVASLARPGGNMTGLLLYEASITGKWLGMLNEIVPDLARVAFMVNTKISTYQYYLQAAETAARALGIEIVLKHVESADEIERTIESFARLPNGGLLLMPDATTILHQDHIIALTPATGCPPCIRCVCSWSPAA